MKANGIGHVVHQSGFVTDGRISGDPIIEGLAEVEQLLDEAPRSAPLKRRKGDLR